MMTNIRAPLVPLLTLLAAAHVLVAAQVPHQSDQSAVTLTVTGDTDENKSLAFL